MKLKEIIFESLLLFEDEKHIRQLFTSWAKKKSGNPELAMSLINDFFKYKKNIKRDFASFSSAEEMVQAIENAKSLEQEKIKASDVDEIHRDDKVLVVAAKTHEASKNICAGTKWCTGAADTDEYWKRHNRTGTEFIWILKGLKQDNPDYKFSLHFKWSKSNNKITQSPSQKFDSDWCNAINSCSSRIPNTLLTILGDDSFDNIFNKCMNYHDKRSQERVTKPISNLKQKFIEKIREFLNGDLHYYFIDAIDSFSPRQFNYQLNERLLYYGIEDFNDQEIDDSIPKRRFAGKYHKPKFKVFDLFTKEVQNHEDEITNRASGVVLSDVQEMDEDRLQQDFEYNTNHDNGSFDMGEDEWIEFEAEQYLNDQLTEIYFEQLGIFMDEFIENWIKKNYDV